MLKDNNGESWDLNNESKMNKRLDLKEGKWFTGFEKYLIVSVQRIHHFFFFLLIIRIERIEKGVVGSLMSCW